MYRALPLSRLYCTSDNTFGGFLGKDRRLPFLVHFSHFFFVKKPMVNTYSTNKQALSNCHITMYSRNQQCVGKLVSK
jgi:hypothetical protein